jgi:hypothetical protein
MAGRQSKLKELRLLLETLREYEVTRYSCSDLTLELLPKRDASVKVDITDPYESLTQEQIEHWSDTPETEASNVA